MSNEAQSFSLFSNTNIYTIPLEIPSEVHQLPHGFTSGILYFQFERKNLDLDKPKKEKFLNLIPVFIMFFIILIETRAYLFWHLLPMLELTHSFTFKGSTNNYQIQLFLFLTLVTNLMLSTILTIFTPPGEIAHDLQLEAENIRENIFQVRISENFLEKMKKFGNCERKRTMFPRFCRSCLMVKPDRSHHCSVCNKCVLKMDHHCPYVNNCIGRKNYKYFMNMVMSGTFASLLISFTM